MASYQSTGTRRPGRSKIERLRPRAQPLGRAIKACVRGVVGDRLLLRLARASASLAGADLEPRLRMPTPFKETAQTICARHAAQTLDTVAALRRKYAQPVLGKVPVWSLIEKLAHCIDPSDESLYCISQQIHVLQILETMERDGVATRDFVLAALLHDVGKVLLLAGEAPEHVVGFNHPIGEYDAGVGLDNCVFQWNHDEFAYSRLKNHLPDGVAWLIRYHSIVRPSCEKYMDARDRKYADQYLTVFARYDHGSKSPYFLPKKRIDDYRQVIADALPREIVF